MTNKPIDKERFIELQDAGLTPVEVSAELGCTPSSICRFARRVGRPFQRRPVAPSPTRRCITCKRPRATEERWICVDCRARHRREGLEYVETYSIPGVTP